MKMLITAALVAVLALGAASTASAGTGTPCGHVYGARVLAPGSSGYQDPHPMATSCGLARNIARAAIRRGYPGYVTAYSPVTHRRYRVHSVYQYEGDWVYFGRGANGTRVGAYISWP